MSDISIKVISQTKDFLVIFKPSGLPSAQISEQDTNNAFSQAASLFPNILQVQGRKQIEHGLIHRLDTVTSGLMIIASNQESYNHLLELQKENKIIKTYTACCRICSNNAELLAGFPPLSHEKSEKLLQLLEQENTSAFSEKILMESYFRAFGNGRKSVRPVTKDSNMAALKKLEKPVLYKTEIELLEKNVSENTVKVQCQISNGYRHQVRCHLAWLGLPIIGDELYDAKYSQEQINFCATKINVDGNIFELN